MNIFLIVPLIIGLVYILYSNGFMFFESKTALTFRGIQKKGCFGAKFKSCNGVTKKVIKLKEERQFTYSPDISNGNIYVTVTARNKSGEYIFDDINTKHIVPPGKYTITTRFDSATGSYRLNW